jgi:hypothetical protein
MKIVDYDPRIHPKAWRGKTNFVDKNNVVVGFDTNQNCCEDFGWYISESEDFDTAKDSNLGDVNYCHDYVFDKSYRGVGDGLFRLTAEGQPDLFLHLYNHHNGYYAHGFDMTDSDGTQISSGSL